MAMDGRSKPLAFLFVGFFVLWFLVEWNASPPGGVAKAGKAGKAKGGSAEAGDASTTTAFVENAAALPTPAPVPAPINAGSGSSKQSGSAKKLQKKRKRPPPPPPLPQQTATKPTRKPGSSTSQPVTSQPAKAADDVLVAAPEGPPSPPPELSVAPPASPPKPKRVKPKLGPFDPTCPTRVIHEDEQPPVKPRPAGWVDKYVNNPNNVVMGLASGYPWGYVRRFVCSLRATGYIGKIVLGGAGFPAQTLAHFAAADVIAETYDGGAAGGDLLTYRFELFRRWVLKHDTGDNLFLISDIRDSYFQRNPFENIDLGGYELHLFEESGYLTHRNETINHDWMQQCFGTVEDMLDKKIINGGGLFGTAKGIAEGCRIVYESATSGRHCNGRDQVYLNKLYHTGRLPSAIAHPQGDPGAPMNVIGYIPRTDGAPFAHPDRVGDKHPGLMIDDEGYVLDHDKRTRSACLHQYDRFIVVDQLIMRLQPQWYTKEACTWRNGKKIAEGIIDW